MIPRSLIVLDRPGLIIDNFAGGGGASTGIEAAIGRSVDIAINHDPEAIAMHRVNHPATRHYCQDVWEVDPIEATAGADGRPQPVALAWFSPDCKHFSKAKGGKPREKKIRDLAWVVHRWVEALLPHSAHPLVIMLENVEEFRTWGPLLDDGRPCPVRKGETFADWCQQLRDFGYAVQWKELKACDYGAPTSRKRLFLIARRDGRPIVWPEPTHGPLRPQPWRTAGDIIDFSIDCPSIFERTRPLADATCRRIAAGVVRHVLNEPEPFIIGVGGRRGQSPPVGLNRPYPTTTAKADAALVLPTLVQIGYGEREGQQPRVPGLKRPLGTAVAGGVKHALVAAFMAQHNAGNGAAPRSMRVPVSTLTARCTQQQLVTSSLVKLRGTCRHGQPVTVPLHTLSAQGRHFAEIRAFLIKYYGNEQDGHGLKLPLGTVTTHERFGLVTTSICGEEYALADIGMRMLTAPELYGAQGFPPGYRIDFDFNGKPLTKTAQVRMVGNSVCPPLPEALVRANLPELCPAERVAA